MSGFVRQYSHKASGFRHFLHPAESAFGLRLRIHYVLIGIRIPGFCSYGVVWDENLQSGPDLARPAHNLIDPPVIRKSIANGATTDISRCTDVYCICDVPQEARVDYVSQYSCLDCRRVGEGGNVIARKWSKSSACIVRDTKLILQMVSAFHESDVTG